MGPTFTVGCEVISRKRCNKQRCVVVYKDRTDNWDLMDHLRLRAGAIVSLSDENIF